MMATMEKFPALAWAVLCTLLASGPLQAQVSSQSTLNVIDINEEREDRIQYGSNARSRLEVAEIAGNPGSLVDFIDRAPGVVKSGQNGLLQVFSIRGAAGQRVQTRFSGVPINSERRAGTGAAFVDPWFLENVVIVKGPASTYFGSGAIGGVVLMEPRFIQGVEANLGYESGSAQRVQSIGFGNQTWSAGVSHREAADGESPLGDPLHSGYEQTSAVLRHNTQVGDWNIDSLWLSSRGRNIGRSNSQYPLSRIGEVASDDHDLLRIKLTTGSGWQAGFYLHDQYSSSETQSIGSSLNLVNSDSLDWGAQWNRSWSGQFLSGEIGAEFDRREGVSAEEYEWTAQGVAYKRNLDAEQTASALYATATLDLTNHSFKAGIRQSWQQQRAENHGKEVDVNTTGFAGWQWFALEFWTVSAEIATAFRSPTLTERYYSGETGRGSNIGNPGLNTEKTPGVDLGLFWQRAENSFAAHWFRTNLEDYIERTVIDAETRSFGNRLHGTISGLEFEGVATIHESLSFLAGLHWVEGEGSGGVPMADIPASELRAGLQYSGADWWFRLHWRHRQSKSRFADTEQFVDAANTLDLDYRYQLSTQADFSVYINNALNDVYRISADELSTFGNKRTVGVRFNYRFVPENQK